MPAEHAPFAEVVDVDRPGVDPPYDYPDYVGTRLRAPKEPLVIIPATLTELTGPAYGESAIGELDARPDAAARRRAARRADHRHAAGCSAATGSRCAGSSSRSGRRTPPAATAHDVDTHDAPLDPNFDGGGPLPHRRRRLVPVHRP